MVEKKSTLFITVGAIALSLLAHAGMWVSLSSQKSSLKTGNFSISIREEKREQQKWSNIDQPKALEKSEQVQSENNIANDDIGINDIKIVYPKRSRQLEEEGKTVLSFLIDQTGKAQNINVIQSSGFERLDHEAMRAVSDATFEARGLEKELTIEFKLKESP